MAARASRRSLTPGVPASRPPALEEPTTPAGPLPPKSHGGGPDRRPPTGSRMVGSTYSVAQQGAFLMMAHGARLADSDHSLTGGGWERAHPCCKIMRRSVSHFDTGSSTLVARGATACSNGERRS